MASRYDLSAQEIRELTSWPDPMIDDYLNLHERVIDLEDLIPVRGVVGSAGAGTGSGFSAAHPGTGIYNITFSVAKKTANYAVIANAASDNHVCVYTSKTTTGFTVRITNAGVLSDSEFNFMVMSL